MKVTKFLIIALLGVGYLPLNAADAGRKRKISLEESSDSEVEESEETKRLHEKAKGKDPFAEGEMEFKRQRHSLRTLRPDFKEGYGSLHSRTKESLAAEQNLPGQNPPAGREQVRGYRRLGRPAPQPGSVPVQKPVQESQSSALPEFY